MAVTATSPPSVPGWWHPEAVTLQDGEPEVMAMSHPLRVRDDPAAPPRRRLQGAIIATRVRRLRSPSVSVSRDRPPRRWFHGHCVGNALCLLDELSRRGIQCRPVTGSHRRDVKRVWNAGTRVRSAREAIHEGVQHHWVEARLDGTWWVLDAAQYRYDSADGTPFIGHQRPEVYRTYTDSRRVGEEYFADVARNVGVEVVGTPEHGRGCWDLSLAYLAE